MRAAPVDELAANAIPFAFGVPLRRRAQIVRHIDRMGEVEGIGTRQIGRRILCLDQVLPSGRFWRPTAHQLVGQGRFVLPGGDGESAGHQLGAHTHAETTGQELVEQKSLIGDEGVPRRKDRRLALVLLNASQGLDRRDPVGEAMIHLLRRVGQNEADGLGEVTDDVIAFLEQPVRQARDLGRPFPQPRGRHRALGAATGKKGDHPDAILGRCRAEIACQRIDLHPGLGGLVDPGE